MAIKYCSIKKKALANEPKLRDKLQKYLFETCKDISNKIIIKNTVKNNTKNQGKKYKIVMSMTKTNNKI